MKKISTILIAAFILFVVMHAAAQSPGTPASIKVGKVINVRDLAKKELLQPPAVVQRDYEEKDDELTGIPTKKVVPIDAKVYKVMADYITNISTSSQLPQTASPAPIQSFSGLPDNNAIIPPDVGGAAGPNHLFETLNSQYRIYNKTGGTVATISLNSFWSGLSGTGFGPFSDPHVVFDSASGRWLACIMGAKTSSGPYAIFLAVSLTNDPTGSWYEYSIATGSSAFLPDYPLLGYNKNWIVITTNDFKKSSFLRTRIIVYNKSKALAGTLTSAKQFFDSSGTFTLSPAETLDPLENKEYFLTDYNGNSGGNGYVQVCSISGKAGSPVYNQGAIIGVTSPWSETSLDAPQLGVSKKINTGATKMRTVMVRNGSIWATHTVYLPATTPTHSSTDFWQIRTSDNAVLQYGLIEDPTAALWTSYPSLAVTPQNDVLIGSTMVGPAIYASAVYSYRNGTDASNTFRSVYTYQAGGNSYYKTFGGTRNRWGDFSSTSLDPSNGTFWTLQEYAQPTVDTWGTTWANVDHPLAPVAMNNSSVALNTGNNITVIPNPGKGYFTLNYQSTRQGEALITVYNFTGNIVYNNKVSVLQGLNRINMDISAAGNGTYKLTIQNGAELKQTEFIISK